MKIVQAESFLFSKQNRALDHIAQLTDITWPGIGLKSVDALFTPFQFTSSQVRCELIEEVLGQHRNIFRSRTQRGKRQRDGTDPEIQIIAISLFRNQLR